MKRNFEDMIVNSNLKKICMEIMIILFCLTCFCYFYIKMKSATLIRDDLNFRYNVSNNIRDIVMYSLHYGNGRLLGNILGVLYAHNRILYAISGAGMMILLIILPMYIWNLKKQYIFVLGLFLLLCDKDFWSEVYLWSSAFANYIPPIICIEFCILFIKISKKKDRKVLVWFIVPFALMGQLFVEHMTVLSLLISIIICIFMKETKIIYSLPYLISCLCGGIVMIVIPKVFAYNDEVKSYRVGMLNDLKGNLYELVSNIYVRLWPVIVCFLILSLFVVYRYVKKINLSKNVLGIIILILAICALLIILKKIQIVMLIFYFFILITCICCVLLTEKCINVITMLVISNIMLLLSFPISQPGARIVFISYYCLVISFAVYLENVINLVKVKNN